MPDYLVYHAAAPEDIHQCAYALLKHLDIYNLKPPPAQQVVIYTTNPAALDAYGTFYNRFDLIEINPEKTATDCLRSFCESHQGPALFMGGSSYPVSELEPMFDEIRGGRVYADHQDPTGVAMMGFLAEAADSPRKAMEAPYRKADGYLAQYPGLKEFARLLRYFFDRYQEESVPNQVKLMHPVDPIAIQKQKEDFLNLPFPARFLRKLTGRGWKIENYTKKM